MKTKILKIILSFFVIFLMFYINSNITLAKWEPANQLRNTVKLNTESNMTNLATDLGGTAITVTRVICMGVAFSMLIVLGIKYMVSAPNDRAQVMKHAWVYFIGAVVMFTSSGIISLIAKAVKY